MQEKIMVSWSGGKDSTLALYELQRTNKYDIYALMTTLAGGYERVSMHGVRKTLLEEQARCLGYPLHQIILSQQSSNEEYAAMVRGALVKGIADGVSAVAFGDIFLEDIRRFREAEIISQVGIQGLFPLWKRETSELAHTFIGLGFKAIITCVDASVLGRQFVGRVFDDQFLSDLPSSVDPCGENGEFHSFVYDGPLFRQRVACSRGEVVFRENRFYYCDLLPKG
jgi:uncharacterized protein (TIGR00290 family)